MIINSDNNKIVDTSLFYPSCGNDLLIPLELYIEIIKDFWFVDHSCCFQSIKPEINRFLLSLGYKRKVEISHTQLHGTTLFKKESYTVEIKTFTYVKICSEREIHIHRCKGEGYNALRSIFDDKKYRLGVFFYRGDSPGGGGSGFYWLGKRTFPYVLNRLIDGGHVVTDGSNAYGSSRLKKRIAKFHRREISLQEVAAQVDDFTWRDYSFSCVGNAGKKYGPTLIWKVMEIS